MLFTSIGFFYEAVSATTLGPAVVKLDNNKRLINDKGFESSILISLGTNARASDQDVLPSTYRDRGGFSGSVLMGYNIGSKFWLLERSIMDETLILKIKQYTKEALLWMIEDKILKNIEVAEVSIAKGYPEITLFLFKPENEKITYQFALNWEN